MENGWTARVKELEAERARLARDNKVCVELNDKLVAEIARIEDRVSEEYEAERADDRARIKELEAENKRLRELVDGAKEIVEIANCTSPARRKRKGGRRMASSYSPYTTKCDACGEIIRDDEKNVGYECDLHERCAHE